MNIDFRVLVAAGNIADARLLRDILSEEFSSVSTSSDPKKALKDFESVRPSVIVLAFGSLAAAERYYLGLFRGSTIIHTLPHRAIVLCFNTELRRAFDLCRQGHFDDYVPYWPTTNDPHRLSMAIRLARRSLQNNAQGQPSTAQIKFLVQRIAELESLMDSHLHAADGHLNEVDRALASSVSGIERVISRFSRELSEGGLTGAVEIRDKIQLRAALELLESSVMSERPPEEGITQPVRRWASDLRHAVSPHLEAVRELETVAARIKPVVLLVEDDELQRDLMDQMLRQLGLEPIQAASAVEAFAMIGERNPCVVLMDIGMPGINGIELTRRLKAIDILKDIPVIMTTGRGDKATVEESLLAGAEDFVVKPVGKSTLARKLQQFITLDPPPSTEIQASEVPGSG